MKMKDWAFRIKRIAGRVMFTWFLVIIYLYYFRHLDSPWKLITSIAGFGIMAACIPYYLWKSGQDEEKSADQFNEFEAELAQSPLEDYSDTVDEMLAIEKLFHIETGEELSPELAAKLGPELRNFFTKYPSVTSSGEYEIALSRDMAMPADLRISGQLYLGSIFYENYLTAYPGDDKIYLNFNPKTGMPEKRYPTIWHALFCLFTERVEQEEDAEIIKRKNPKLYKAMKFWNGFDGVPKV